MYILGKTLAYYNGQCVSFGRGGGILCTTFAQQKSFLAGTLSVNRTTL